MDDGQLAAEALAVLGAVPARVEPLLHSQHGVTVGVWRVRTERGTAIRKLIGPRAEAGPRVDDPTSFRFWRREALLLGGGLPDAFPAAGLRPPRLLGQVEVAPDRLALWLEDVERGERPSLTDAAVGWACRRLGRAQGRLAMDGGWDRWWLSRGFIREYLDSAGSQTPMDLLDDDAAWATEPIRAALPATLRQPIVRLHTARARLIALLEACPRTLCHLDFWPANLFEDDGGTVAIDWAFAGEGALGEDVGNLVPDAVNDLHVPSDRLPDLDRAAFGGYVAGLRDIGWDGDERIVRLAMCAAAVKYSWLAAAMLDRAGRPGIPGYGGAPVDERLLFAERAAVLRYLVDRAAEAEQLAPVLVG